MRLSMLFFSAMLVADMATADTISPSQQLDISRDNMTKTIAILGQTIGARGDQQLKDLFDATVFEVKELGYPVIEVFPSTTNRNKVLASAEFLLLLTYIADQNIIISTNQAYLDCGVAYTTYLTTATAKLQETGASNGERILAPEEFASNRRDLCRDFAKFFPIASSLRASRDRSVYAAAAFMLLHELGHIALRHHSPQAIPLMSNGKPDTRAVLELMRFLRVQEDAADQWATDRAVDLGATSDDVINSTLIGTFLSFSGINCSLEREDDHANGAERMKRIIERFIRQKSLTSNPVDAQRVDLANQYIQVANRARLAFACGS